MAEVGAPLMVAWELTGEGMEGEGGGEQEEARPRGCCRGEGGGRPWWGAAWGGLKGSCP
jgi:hypothetical protein